MNKMPSKIIDFHVHLFPDRLFDSIWTFFSDVYKWEVLYKFYYRECVNFLNKQKVSHIVYSNYAHKRDVAQGLNQWNHHILDEFDEVYCFAAFHPDDSEAIEIAKKAIAHPKVLGFKLQLLVQNFYPYDERLFPLYDLVIENKKRILLHVGTGPVGNEYVGYKQFTRLLNRYPDLPANVAHMGGLEYLEFIQLLSDHPNLYMDTSFSFLEAGELGFNLDSGYLENNKDQLVYGSDFPNLIFPREEEIDRLLSLSLSEEFYNKLFFENGLKLIDQHGGETDGK